VKENSMGRKLTSLGLVLAIIIVGEIILHSFELPTWPAFLVMILFMLGGMDEKKVALPILGGGLLGIFSIIPIRMFVIALAPLLGVFYAKLLFIVIFVCLMFLLREKLPYIFNTYAFLFLIITGLASSVSEPNTWLWMAVQFLGGGVLILSLVGVKKIIIKLFINKQREMSQPI